MNSIYIKKGPDRNIKEEYAMAVLNGLEGINYCITPYGIYDLDKDGNYSSVITYSYDGCDSFWDAYYDDLNIVVENNEDRKVFRQRLDLKRKFISLEDFLCEGSFIGQLWHRTKPIEKPLNNFNVCLDRDCNYMDEGVYIALYKYNGIILSFNMKNGKYELINSKYTFDGNYKLSGSIRRDMKDEEKIINDIYDQLSDKKIRKR